MRLGIIARCDSRGIAYQTEEACRGLQPDRVLVVMLHDKRWPERPDRYRDYDCVFADSDLRTRKLDLRKVRQFMAGLDVVFAVETLYDWEMMEIADGLGVHVVVQGNPEFYTHPRDPDRPHPDLWVWPTPWLLDDMPGGTLLPVPAPPTRPAAADPGDETLRVLHVAGHRALGDRNGTDLFYEAIPLLGPGVHVTVVGQDGQLASPRLPRGVTYEAHPNGVEDRWRLYENQHVVVLPRRYGGLSLPAIEACAAGVVPMMPDVAENSMWPILPLQAKIGRRQRVPAGSVPTWLVRPNQIAYEIDKLNRDRHLLDDAQARAIDWAATNQWEDWLPTYRDALAP